MHICEQHEKHMMAACIIIQQIKIFLFKFKCISSINFFLFYNRVTFLPFNISTEWTTFKLKAVSLSPGPHIVTASNTKMNQPLVTRKFETF